MPDTTETTAKPEEWRNDTLGKIGIIRFDRDGREDMDWIPGGRLFFITPDERKANQRAVALPQYDPFTNGSFRAVSGLDEGDPDYAKLVDQPDAMTDDEIDQLLDGGISTFEEVVLQVTSETTLRRILDKAEAEGAAARRLNLVRDRLHGLDRRSPMKGDTVTDGDPEVERTAPKMSPGEDDGQPGPRRYEIDTELAAG